MDVPEDHSHQHAAQHQHPLCVPVRDTACGFALRLFRNRDGSRCAAAFTSEDRLVAVLGPDQRWLPLPEPALRDLAEPLGVLSLIVDPALVAAPVSTGSNPSRRPCGPQQTQLPQRKRPFASSGAPTPLA